MRGEMKQKSPPLNVRVSCIKKITTCSVSGGFIYYYSVRSVPIVEGTVYYRETEKHKYVHGFKLLLYKL